MCISVEDSLRFRNCVLALFLYNSKATFLFAMRSFLHSTFMKLLRTNRENLSFAEIFKQRIFGDDSLLSVFFVKIYTGYMSVVEYV